MNNDIFKIWMTGFYEGEGSISNDISNNNKLRLCISQNDVTPLEKAKEVWGGSVRQRIRKSPASDKICIGYEWRIGHTESLKFIEDIRQYMIIPYKINQLENALKTSTVKLDRKFKCKLCEKEYASPSGRTRHFKSEHTNTDTSQ